MMLINSKKNSYSKYFIWVLFYIFIVSSTAETAWGAGLLPGFYGSTSNSITAPNINSLPSLRNIVQGISSLEYIDDNQLIIHQNEKNAIIDWDSFDIGVNAWTHFEQQNDGTWKVLNRIYDQDPSKVFGRITADGHVYLINQNGMFFSPNSKINVGSLVASSLNINDEDFLSGSKNFIRENYINPGVSLEEGGIVSNHGTINTDDIGSVYLLGTCVENNGEISAYLGWVALAAGNEVSIYQEEGNERIKNIVDVTDGGEVHNFTDGSIYTDLGQAGLYGRTVSSDGVIRAVTAVRKNGRIELYSEDKVVLGENSLTSTPVSNSTEEVHNSFPFRGGEIDVKGNFENYGNIVAPSGKIDINANDRIYLAPESSIDVSGMWVDLPVSAKTVEMQLNSVDLRDDYGQKEGVLKGETISFSALSGSSIGDFLKHLSIEEKTAMEKAVRGGRINLNAKAGDIILRENALLDMSGGGINYIEGHVDTTKLISENNTVYDISDAPQWENYKGILGTFTKTHERYGVNENYDGLYYGSASPLFRNTDSFIEGSDAGAITLISKRMVLEGIIDGSAATGKYQVYYPSENVDMSLYDAMGLSVPQGGILQIGDASIQPTYDYTNPVLEKIVVDSSFGILPEDFTSIEPFPESRDGITYIPSGLINEAGLDTLGLYSRTGISIKKGADISLLPGGTFIAETRKITHEGNITIAGGTIKLSIKSNITTDAEKGNSNNPDYVSREQLGHERIFIAPESSLSVSGEYIDNRGVDGLSEIDIKRGIVKGGNIYISDQTLEGEGVIIADNSAIDVSGGFTISGEGDVDGKDAGSLSISGNTVILDGKITGYSTPGNSGGSISLHAASVSVQPDKEVYLAGVDGEIPDHLKNSLIISGEEIESAGFTNISLIALNNINIPSGLTLKPSDLKYHIPLNTEIDLDNGTTSKPLVNNIHNLQFISVDEKYLDDSSISLKADKTLPGDVIPGINQIEGIVNIESDTSIEVFPGGVIEIQGRQISSAGKITARGGNIDISGYNVSLLGGSLVSVSGYYFEGDDTTLTGLPINFTAVDGGEINLSGTRGDVDIAAGAVIDISGSDKYNNYFWDEDGNIKSVELGSNPGAFSVSFSNDFIMNGEILVETGVDRLQGGTLNLQKTSLEPYSLKVADLAGLISRGFDSINLKSNREIIFDGTSSISADRNIIFDSPIISGTSGSSISIESPWVVLKNSYFYDEKTYSGVEGDSTLTIDAGIIDINGYVILSSFNNVSMSSKEDIRLSDYYYSLGGRGGLYGGLELHGKMQIQANRIYPETLSSFTIKSSGDFTLFNNGGNTDQPIFSAGGMLEVLAPNIYNNGNIFAPLGEILLNATDENGAIYLGDESILSTHADVLIKYGLFDNDALFWGLTNETGNLDLESPIDKAPAGSVTIEAESLITAKGSGIDVSGGGEVFSYIFMSGIEGSANPLKNSGQYIILPDNSVYNPGKTIQVTDNKLLPAGEYYLLPEEYAFLPEAVVLTDLGTGFNPTEFKLTEEGYDVIQGRFSIAETGLTEKLDRYFSLRSSEDLLSQGHFETKSLTAGYGGSVSLKGNTTILEGAISGESIDDSYAGGVLELAGKEIIVKAGQEEDSLLPETFDPSLNLHDQLPPGLFEKLIISDNAISGQGMDNIILGDVNSTNNLAFESGVGLSVTNIRLNATDSISIGEDVVIEALSDTGDGAVSFIIPEGAVIVADNSLIHASDNIDFNAKSFDIRGNIQVDNSLLSILSEKIIFVSDDNNERTESAAYISESLWSYLSNTDTLRLGESSEIVFDSSFDLNISSEILLDASLISTADSEITISTSKITFLNSGDPSGRSENNGTGKLTVNSDKVYLSEGIVQYDGFSEISINSTENITVLGEGSTITGNAHLVFNAGEITSSLLKKEESFNSMNYSINTGSSNVTILSNGNYTLNNATEGGRFNIVANSIFLEGTLNMPGSYIKLLAEGQNEGDGIFLDNGAFIYAKGGDYLPGGNVLLSSENGIVSLSQNSAVDVSAGSQGDSGEIRIISPSNSATLAGNLNGISKGGSDGSFSLDTLRIDDLGSLIEKVSDGGFYNKIALKAREGDIILDENRNLYASGITVSADGNDGHGNIYIYGSLSASENEEKSYIKLYANNNLSIQSGSRVSTASNDSEIILSGKNNLLFENGAEISMNSSEGGAGSTVFRSARNGNDSNFILEGSVSGADSVVAETVFIYDENDHDGFIDNEIDLWESDITFYMADAGDRREALFQNIILSDNTDTYLRPVIEVESGNDLTINNPWDLKQWRYDRDNDGVSETAGSLILRSAGNLFINEDIKDAPTANIHLFEKADASSWNIGLVSGSQLSSADPFYTIHSDSGGDLIIDNGNLVYTERGDLEFFSGGDTLIGGVNSNFLVSSTRMGFNLGTYSGQITGNTGGSLIIDGGAIQSSVGDVNLTVNSDLMLGRRGIYLGSIRSVGTAASSDLFDYINYAVGGDIRLRVEGNINGLPSKTDPWDQSITIFTAEGSQEYWAASYGPRDLEVTQGIAAMSGGDISIKSGGNFSAGTGIFGQGDLSIYSGGNINGRFLVKEGTGNLAASGNFGTRDAFDEQHIELFDAELFLTVGGNIELGTIVNPTLASLDFTSDSSWNLSYTTDTAVSLKASFGDVLFTGGTRYYDPINQQLKQSIIPSNLSIIAGRDILFNSSYVMTPSPNGQLYLEAGNDIRGDYIESGNQKRATIYMSDLDPDEIYGDKNEEFSSAGDVLVLLNALTGHLHGEGVVHRDDSTEVFIKAGHDIKDIELYLPKKSEIIAGRDIADIYYNGQNVHSDDVSIISADNNILFTSSLTGQLHTGIEHGGPGILLVNAGNNIDLGTTDGIQLVGSQYNPYLMNDDNDLILLSGMNKKYTLDEVKVFFDEVEEKGARYSKLLAEGKNAEADDLVNQMREDTVKPFFNDYVSGTGNIDMVESQINVTGSSGDVYILAMGEINVGKTTFSESGNVESDAGIYTTAGGSLNTYSKGDLNVNESRLMTFAGGDITVWVDEGDINAGRGSKTSVNATESQAVYDETTGTWSIVFEAPAVGSGIRTLTFDPDGLEGPRQEPLPGDVYLFAPEGEIDAGEAGISGSNVILGATEIVNAQNISFSQGSVGVPVQTASVNLGALAGTSSLTDTAGMADDAASTLASTRDEAMQEAMKALEDFIAKWLSVEVVGFYKEENDEEK